MNFCGGEVKSQVGILHSAHCCTSIHFSFGKGFEKLNSFDIQEFHKRRPLRWLVGL